MATVHLFPYELIRHTLSLAHPPGKRGSGKGLCATALVHSSWKEPSQSLMTEDISFRTDQKVALSRFVAHGPSGFSSAKVEFLFCPVGEVRAALAKAKSGGIRSLVLAASPGSQFGELFGMASLCGKQWMTWSDLGG